MKLRTGMLLGATLLVVAIIAATISAVVVVVDRGARAQLQNDLGRSRQVFEDMLGYRQSVLRSDCRVVSNEPRLRAMVATPDVSRATVQDMVAELHVALGGDLFLLTDEEGRLIVDAADPAAEGFDLSARPAVAAAKKSGHGAAVWILKDRPFQVQACRVDFGAHTVGIVIVGRAFNDEAADAIQRQTGSTIVIALDGKRVAGSASPAEPPAELASALAVVGTADAEVKIGGIRQAASGGKFPTYDGQRDLRFLLLRSLDEALAPGRRLTMTIIGIAGISLAVALLLAFLLAGRLSRPVDELVQFTGRIAKGELSARARGGGASEVRALARAMNQMVDELDTSRNALAINERLHREMEIATRIQTSILPKMLDVEGLEIAASMIPATEVGGDYYDVLPVKDGCWIGIGDVAGHGLTAGLEMLMVQSVIAALVQESPTASPKHHLAVLNHVVFDNIRNRLGQDEHITFTLLHCIDGRVTFAGAHEEILVCRAAGGPCERVDTPGTWIGAMRDVSHVSEDSTLELATGDLMVLYTDGVTEARGQDGTQFGMDRLCAVIEDARTESVKTVRDRIIAAVQDWQVAQDDDITVLVARCSA